MQGGASASYNKLMYIRPWIFLFLLLAGLVRPAPGQITATLAAPSAARAGAWELLVVRFPWPSGGGGGAGREGGTLMVTVQDARGGPVIARSPLTAPGEEVLMPLPLLAPSELPSGRWPVRVTVERGGERGETIEQAEVVVSRVEGAGGNSGMGGERVGAGEDWTFRVLVPQGQRESGVQGGEGDQPVWSRLTGKPVVLVPVPLEELLGGSPLLFAAYDAVLITPVLRRELGEARAVMLMNAGVRLVASGESPGSGGSGLSRLVWDRVWPAGTETSHGAVGSGNGHTPPTTATWVSPADAARRPVVVEPGLAQLSPRPLRAPPALRGVVLLAGPAAVVLVLLSRGVFRRRGAVLVAVVLSLSLLGGGLILAARRLAWGEPEADQNIVGWEVVQAPPAASGRAGAAWVLREVMTTVRPLFSRKMEVLEEGLCFPVAPSPHAYFALRDTRISLEDVHRMGGGGRTRLTLRIPQRQHVTWLSRSLALGLAATPAQARTSGLLPPLPRTTEERERFRELTGIDLRHGVWIEGGYVVASEAFPGADVRGELFTSWAARQPEAAAAAAWYELRFAASHLYFCQRGSVSPSSEASPSTAAGGGEARLRLIDFGLAPGGSMPW